MAFEHIEHTGGIDRKTPALLLAALQMILDTHTDMVFVKDVDLVYRAATSSFAKMVGKASVEEVLGRTDQELFGEELAELYTADDRKLLESGEHLLNYVEPITDENGKARYSSTSKYILTDENGETVGLMGVGRDISEEIRTQQRYQQEIESLYTLPADAYTATYIDITDWRLLGQRRQKTYGYCMPSFTTLESFVRFTQDAVQDPICEACAFYQDFNQQKLLSMRNSGIGYYSLEYLFCAEGSGKRWVYDELKFMTDPNTGHQCLMIVTRDVTSAKKA